MKKTSRPIPELQLNPILDPLRDKFPAILFQFWQCGCFGFFYGWQWPNSQRSLVMSWRIESNAYEYCMLAFFFEFVYRLQHLQLCTRDPVFGSLKHNNLPLADPATSYNRLVTCYNKMCYLLNCRYQLLYQAAKYGILVNYIKFQTILAGP